MKKLIPILILALTSPTISHADDYAIAAAILPFETEAYFNGRSEAFSLFIDYIHTASPSLTVEDFAKKANEFRTANLMYANVFINHPYGHMYFLGMADTFQMIAGYLRALPNTN